MNSYIILLRGVNVGGHRKIPMAELRKLLFSLGYENVQTYIQSGNVVLQSEKSSEQIKLQIEEEILECFGFDVVILVKLHKKLQHIFSACPFTPEEKEKSYFMMLDNNPDAKRLEEVSKLSFKDEKFHITDDCIYFYSATGYGRTKFNSNFFERQLKVNVTARNYKTMLKILAIAKETESKL